MERTPKGPTAPLRIPLIAAGAAENPLPHLPIWPPRPRRLIWRTKNFPLFGYLPYLPTRRVVKGEGESRVPTLLF